MMLSKFYQEKRSKAMEELGGFYAFGEEQLIKGLKKVGAKNRDEVTHLCAGLVVLKANAEELQEKLSKITDEAIQDDIEKNGVDAIIRRELIDHECFYTYDYSDAVYALKGYGINEDKIAEVFRKEIATGDYDY